MAQLKRLHMDLGNGSCQACPVVVDEQTGEAFYKEVVTAKPVKKSTQINAGLPVVSTREAMKIMSNFTNNNTSMNNGINPAIYKGENTQGRLIRFREETGDDAQPTKIITVTLDNTAAAATAEGVIGDNHGLVANGLSIGALPVAVNVTGTWAANTLAFLKQITGANPYRLHKLNIQSFNSTSGADSDAFFTSGYIRKSRADEANNTTQDVLIPVIDLVTQNSFRTNIRELVDFRFLLDGFAALHFLIPADTKVTFTMHVRSVNMTYGMNLVSGKM